MLCPKTYFVCFQLILLNIIKHYHGSLENQHIQICNYHIFYQKTFLCRNTGHCSYHIDQSLNLSYHKHMLMKKIRIMHFFWKSVICFKKWEFHWHSLCFHFFAPPRPDGSVGNSFLVLLERRNMEKVRNSTFL